MARLSSLITLMFTTSMAVAQTPQIIEFDWLNFPCGDMLHCDEGCSACNMPSGGTSLLFGTNMAWVGVSTCPHPISSGDNAVLATGWSAEAGPDHYLVFSGIAAVPMTIDSVIVNHTSATNGPSRLKVEFTNNSAAALQEVADVQVPPSFDTQVFTNLGAVDFPEGAVMGTFQIRLTPYAGWGEGWAVNTVRVVATPTQAAVGISEIPRDRTMNTIGPWFDVMGRPIGAEPAPGVYVGPTKVVRVF